MDEVEKIRKGGAGEDRLGRSWKRRLGGIEKIR